MLSRRILPQIQECTTPHRDQAKRPTFPIRRAATIPKDKRHVFPILEAKVTRIGFKQPCWVKTGQQGQQDGDHDWSSVLVLHLVGQ